MKNQMKEKQWEVCNEIFKVWTKINMLDLSESKWNIENHKENLG